MPIKKTWGLLASIAGVTAALAAPSAAFAGAQQPAYVEPIPMDQCVHPETSQTLLAFGDANQFFLAPGGAFDDVTGWELLGGATVVQTVQPDGSIGNVLDLPQRSQATSPPLCITADYPMARLFARGLTGSEDVDFAVVYWDSKKGEWTKPKVTGKFRGEKKGWTLSKEMNVDPKKDAGWQQVRFVFYTDGKSNVQVDNFWVDPRASR